MMSAVKSAPRSGKPAVNAAVAYHAEERALLRAVHLQSLSALDEMYAYWGSDRA